MNRRLIATTMTFALLLMSAQGMAYDTIDELKTCARTADDATRAACYETLGESVLAADAPATLPDALGGTEFAKKAGEPEEANRGLVTSCQKGADKKWFYFFASGQVWKQIDSRRRRHKDCHFNVTITRDGFGYKMTIDGSKDKIRINRRR